MAQKVFLLHGLGGRIYSLWILAQILKFYNYDAILIGYPSKQYDLNNLLDIVSDKISQHADFNEPIKIIGHSYGGIIARNLHKKGWNISNIITISSPHHGAHILDCLPENMVRWICGPSGFDIMAQKRECVPPPHKYHTISTSWSVIDFDGRIDSQTMILDPKNNTHIPFSDHVLGQYDPRIIKSVLNHI